MARKIQSAKPMTSCANRECKHEYDLHDIGGSCSFPGCACNKFVYPNPREKGKALDEKVGAIISRFKSRKSKREELESV